MNWYLMVLRNYSVFVGRARRVEFWTFTLINFVIYVLVQFLDYTLGTSIGHSEFGLLSVSYNIALLIPSLAVLVRRLHDVGKSGTMFFVVLIPIVGVIWLLVLLLSDSQKGANQFGPYPKEDTISDNESGNPV